MFWQRSGGKHPVSESVKQALVRQQGYSPDALNKLSIVEESGSYSGRKVTYFRVFDAVTVGAAGGGERFQQLEKASILHSGHIEADGQVILTSNKPYSENGVPLPVHPATL